MGNLGQLRRPCRVPAGGRLALLLGLIAAMPATASPPPPQQGLVPDARLADPWGPTQLTEQWAQVLTATDTWLVLQDRVGRQYPVAFDAVGLFVVRWPTTLDRIAPTALVEVTGMSLPSNLVQATQADIFEGTAQRLVNPGLLTLTNAGYPVQPIDFLINADAYGAPFPGLDNPIQGGQQAPAAPVHLVGPIVNRFPLRIAIPGTNNALTVLPGPGGLNLSQVTLGTPRMVQPGDIVYFVASSARPRSLILPQLVVYKQEPMDGIRPGPR